MAKRGTIVFIPATAPIHEPVTKFGGQPTWLEAPQWPLSRESGKPMRFIGQIALTEEIFGSTVGRMAFLFMTDDEDDYVDGTWEPDGGENAVIVQPGEVTVPTQSLAQGPTLYRMVHPVGADRLVPEPCEFGVRLTLAEDPPFVAEQNRWERGDEENRRYYDAVDGNKVGGTPGFIQGDEFPGEQFTKLLLQLDSNAVPFAVNFGDCGVGYAFLSADSRTGKFLWQCA